MTRVRPMTIGACPRELTITRPDDWHLHLRDGAALAAVVPDSARQFARAIVMPNLRPPVTTDGAGAGLPRAHPAPPCPQGCDFEPLMTLYLTDKTPPDEIRARAAPASSRSSSTRPARRPTATPA